MNNKISRTINDSQNSQNITEPLDTQHDITITNIQSNNNTTLSDNHDETKIKMKNEFMKHNCNDFENFYTPKCNKLKLQNEHIDRTNAISKQHLFPMLDDPSFNIRLAEKAEFNDTKYDGKVHDDLEKHADELANMDFELQPHQNFVKNFMSYETPYNSLLLFHGLGTGKTCSAIGVCEEMRNYSKNTRNKKRILIVANENVQDNFKKQLFDESKLSQQNGKWHTQSCIGNSLINEVSTTSKGRLSKEKLISQINNVIQINYLFLGYEKFANYIIRTLDGDITKKVKDVDKLSVKQIRKLQKEFDGRLVVIDEVHNIRKSDDNDLKKNAFQFEQLVRHTKNMRLLFLSATPMFNSHTEIIWLLNIMNINDKRGIISNSDVFDSTGNVHESGREILIRKATGYVSFVRGENPYTFPYRIYPNQFKKENTFDTIKYPSIEMNETVIQKENENPHFPLYLNKIGDCDYCGECQFCNYIYCVEFLRNKNFNYDIRIGKNKGKTVNMPAFNEMESFGYTVLMNPIENLIVSYPHPDMKKTFNVKHAIERQLEKKRKNEMEESTTKNDEKNNEEIIDVTHDSIENLSEEKIFSLQPQELTGKKGLERVMNFIDNTVPSEKGQFEYKKDFENRFGRIFSKEKIGKYSKKIETVLNCIANEKHVSEGVILIYSQYIDSGLIPMALALEEFGFTRFGNHSKPLFKTKPSDVIDVRTMKTPLDKKDFKPAKYILITGDKRLSPNNDYDVKHITEANNASGEKIKVVLISKAGSEGIDFKFIRQVHILEPWYNINRIEQVIGRAVRSMSHQMLSFEKRNVQLYMHGTVLMKGSLEETADLYVYRAAQEKSILMGKVSRILKENAVDCVLNYEQLNFTQENLKKIVRQRLSNGDVIENLRLGDVPFSSACDFMDTCKYECVSKKDMEEPSEIITDTYTEKFISMNFVKIKEKIKSLFKEEFFYKKRNLITRIRAHKPYPHAQIYFALSIIIDDESEVLLDKYGREGNLINIGEFYLFQPIELKDINTSIYEISTPFEFKQKEVILNQTTSDLQQHNVSHQNKEVLDDIISQIAITEEYENGKILNRGDEDWYAHCGNTLSKIKMLFPEMEIHLKEFIVMHSVDVLPFQEKLQLLNYIYASETDHESRDEVIQIKKYFDAMTITTANVIAMLLYNVGKRTTVIMNDENQWVVGTHEDEREISLSNEFKSMEINHNDINKIIGFIAYENSNKYLVFKTKKTDAKRNAGARCEEAGKPKSFGIMNEILGEKRFTTENTKQIKTKGKITQEGISQIEFCIIQEFILRYYHKIKKNGKLWFFNPDQMLLYNL